MARKATRAKRWILLTAALGMAVAGGWAWLAFDRAGARGRSTGTEVRVAQPTGQPSKDVRGVEVRAHIDRASRAALREILEETDAEDDAARAGR